MKGIKLLSVKHIFIEIAGKKSFESKEKKSSKMEKYHHIFL